ncbi:MAG: class I tRNA ligase family protein, partial [Clostridia bacterium]|nr:class I tRNA ligase family protein [Clostridia bacterium]
YIELVKPRLNDKGSESNIVAQNVLVYVLSETLKLLHPFMPFITEEIWQSLPHTGESIMISDYPKFDSALDFSEDEERMASLIATIRAIRNLRSEMNVPPSKKAALTIVSERTDIYNEKTEAFFVKLASASSLTVLPEYHDEKSVQTVTENAVVYIPLAEMIDFEKELARLEGERKNTIGEIERLEKKLSNAGFVAKAPAQVVEGERAKLTKYRDTLEKIMNAIEKFKN